MSTAQQLDEYVAGFFDGDGCIHLPKPGRGTSKRPHAYVTMSQSHENGHAPELIFVQRRHGGSLQASRRRTEGSRLNSQLGIFEKAEEFLRLIASRSVLKAREADAALRYSRDPSETVESARETLSAMKKRRSDFQVDRSKITDSYVAGLFAADGHVDLDVSGGLRATIAGKKCESLSAAIRDHIGVGYLRQPSGDVLFQGDAAMVLLRKLIPLMQDSQKLPQMRVALGYAISKTTLPRQKRTEEQQQKLEETRLELKRMKKQ